MAGVKGRSGRRTTRVEEKRHKVIDKSWDIAEQYLNDETISLKDRAEMASKIIVKDMPTQVEGEIQHNHFYKEIIAKPSLNRIAEYATDIQE